MFGLNTIARRLPVTLLLSAMLVSLGVGTASYLVGSQVVSQLTQRSLAALAHERAKQVKAFMEAITSDLESTANSQGTNQAIRDFGNAWLQIQGDRAGTLEAAFVTNNPNPPEKRMTFDDGPSNLNYSVTHSQYNPTFRQQLLAHGYSDIYLVGADGNVYYTVNKGTDFTANVKDTSSPLAGSGLAQVFAAAIAEKAPGGPVVFSDFAPYGSNKEISAFMALPMFNLASGRMMGIIAFRIQPPLLSAVVSDRTGLGGTGEVLVVGSDHLLRVHSNFAQGNDVLVTKLQNVAVDAALKGSAATGTSNGYRNADMLVAAEPITGIPAKWAVAAVMAESEAFAPVASLRNTMIEIGALLLTIAAAAGLLFSRSVTKPITKLTETMKALAEGSLAADVPGFHRRDEIGEMARTVAVFRENALKVNTLTEEERAGSERRRLERTNMMQSLRRAFGEVVDGAVRGDFNKRVEAQFADPELNALAASVNNLVETVDRGLGETGRVLAALAQTDLTHRVEGDYEGAFKRLKTDTNAVAEKLSEIVGRLRNTSRTLKTATGEILSGANDLSERTTKQAATIEETAAAMAQLSTTVLRNAQQATDASMVAANVTRTAEEGGAVMLMATAAMERITDSSGEISNIIGLIDNIAFQTNLLALNASVEAARAGDAGKGFAVVAVEVRRLAQSAAQASSKVKRLIEQSGAGVKTGSRLLVEAATKLDAILTAARSSNELMDGIAKQSQEQAEFIEEVNAAVRQMDVMTQHNAALVEQTNASIEQTEQQAVELDTLVELFRLDEATETLNPGSLERRGLRGDKLRLFG